MLTDKGSSNNPNPVSVDLDQETVTNTNQVKDSNINPDNPSAIHLDDISPVLNKQTDINHNVKNTSNYFSVNIIMSNSRVTFSKGSDGNDFTHERNIKSNSQNENTPIPKQVSKSKKVEQQRAGSIVHTKSQVLCCKLSIALIMCCTIGITLMPIVIYYVIQNGNNVPTGLEYSHERNISTAQVC